MDSFQFVKDRIPGFPGYQDAEARRRADRMVRASAGEALVELQDRLGLGEDEGLAQLLTRVEFANQASLGWLEDALLDPNALAGMADADRDTLALVERAKDVETSVVSRFVADLTGALDARDLAMLAAVSDRSPA